MVSAREQREIDEFELGKERRIRRTGPVTLLILIVLLFLVGLTTAIDMRRLNTPGGTALSWVEAATFGDCERYRELSVQPDGVLENRTSTQVCRSLRARTQSNREQQTTITIRLVRSRDGEATVDVERVNAPTARAEVNLVERDGRWRVVLDGDTCNPVGCA